MMSLRASATIIGLRDPFAFSVRCFNRSMSRRSAAIVLGGKDLPSGVRTVSSFTLALRSLGLKLRTPNWIKADFMRLTTRVCSWTNPSRSRCGRLASSSSMVGTIATVQWPRSPRSNPRKPRFNIAVSSRSVLARRCSRDTATLVAWMTCASMPRSRSQRASQKLSRPVSYATAIRVIGLAALIASSRQPCSSFSRSSGFGSNFFSGSRLTPGISPATSQFDRPSSMTAISVLSCMKAAGLALLLSWGFCIRSSVNCKLIEATILQLSRRLPHSIFFGPGSVLVGSYDGGVDNQIFDIRIIGHRLEDPPPIPLEAPTTEATKYTVPVPECFRQITPGRARTNDPKHAFHEHPVVAPGRAFLVRPTYNQRRHPLPCRIAQNQPIHHTQGRLPKRSLESDLLLKGNP